MTLRLFREATVESLTFGALYVDGRFQCWTLEDAIREVPGQPVSAWKVPRETAIPEGTYRVALTVSKRFGVLLPELWDVPGFTGIRIHPGNTIADTEGCILVGRSRHPGGIGGSKVACNALIEKLQSATDSIRIHVENYREDAAA